MGQEPLADDQNGALQAHDHRILGPALDLFMFSDYSPGIAAWMPKGMILYNQLLNLIREEYEKRGFDEVRAPLIWNSDLWKKSGHYEHFKSNMFFLESEGQEFALKPMNCPGHCVMMGQRIRSYRELPVRYAEMSPLHRNEPSGSLEGLKRVRSFSQDDAHIFCRPDQMGSEILSNIEFVRYIYAKLGFQFRVELALRPANSIGSDELWKLAEDSLRTAIQKAKLEFKENPGEGAFYGPKIEFHLRDAKDHYWQCGTIQLDFNLPGKDRFNLQYRDQENHLVHPVMIHRAIFGSFERMIACLIEYYKGEFPVWLAPEQVRIIPVHQSHHSYAQAHHLELRGAKIRSSVDLNEENLGPRVKNALDQKIPYIVVVGNKEVVNGSIAVRSRQDAKPRDSNLNELIGIVQAQLK